MNLRFNVGFDVECLSESDRRRNEQLAAQLDELPANRRHEDQNRRYELIGHYLSALLTGFLAYVNRQGQNVTMTGVSMSPEDEQALQDALSRGPHRPKQEPDAGGPALGKTINLAEQRPE